MNNLIYPKLALTNIKKNSKNYVPYILTCIGTVIMYYIMYSMSINQGLDQMSGGNDLKMILNLGNYVIALFSVIFLFYTNSFLIKQRKKEFGLFNILGMEKRHLSKIVMYETLYVALVSLILGLLGGILLNKLMFLMLLKILNFEVPMGFFISIKAIIATLILFGIIFILTLLNTMRQIHLAKPIELLKGGQTGEREPKTKWVYVGIGLLCLGGGYYIAITTKEPLAALSYFFLAVILVIIGTYCLFTAISIAFLKFLRKNKGYYYKTKHFISVSGMIYRMKQNAVGLANICVLSTMVLVIVSTTISLYIGMEDVLRNRYPRDIIVNTGTFLEEDGDQIRKIIDDTLEKHQLTGKNRIDLEVISFVAKQKGNVFSTGQMTDSSLTGFTGLYFIPLEDYNRNTGKEEILEENEILLFTQDRTLKGNEIIILDETFTVKDRLKNFIDGFDKVDVVNNQYIVVKNMSVVDEIRIKVGDVYGEEMANPTTYIGFDLDASDEEIIAVHNEMRDIIKKDYPDCFFDAAAVSKESFYSVYGGLFFLGIFLGILFMMATILIIYYKQISEGYEDKERFAIMKKVGLSHDEVKKIIHSQVLTVFFLPLITAVIHIAFAFQVITKLLTIFNLTNVMLFALCTCGTILVFACFYGIIYTMTAKEYYMIVK
ncbi:putative ABC transport system permease protein [Mobilisporobacter senegalensis]|uniref:Putative ABC transport system permease protein n=1 Tax=Mobilisporobacter senegalensis TaxID=1329262 RepID=A0A3N1XL17_9FIRM|nr:ABC transporter permease [Mobilisporobacter senegalensis]ROR27409.1 putative ABC transport system permease protein [Mobilisporobacter senegalensis]